MISDIPAGDGKTANSFLQCVLSVVLADARRVLSAVPPVRHPCRIPDWPAFVASCPAGAGRLDPSWAPGNPAAPWPASDRRSCRHERSHSSSSCTGNPPDHPSCSVASPREGPTLIFIYLLQMKTNPFLFCTFVHIYNIWVYKQL